MRLKVRSEVRGKHVHLRFWMGHEGQTLAPLGELCMDAAQWGVLRMALELGARGVPGLLSFDVEIGGVS